MKNKIQSQTSPLTAITDLYPGVHLAWFHCEEIAKTALPGQFVMVSCDDYQLRRPFAVHEVSPTRDSFAILFAVVGKGTAWLSAQNPGVMLNILGPLGNGFSFAGDAQNILLVAGGLGIAPLRFVAQVANESGKSVTILQGAASVSGVYPEHCLPEQTECFVATEDGSYGSHCLVTDMLNNYIDQADQIMACGPNAMYHPIAEYNNRLLNPKPFQVSLEVRMGCGFGACYGCSIKTAAGMKKVCHDGPVFNYNDILWDAAPGI